MPLTNKQLDRAVGAALAPMDYLQASTVEHRAALHLLRQMAGSLPVTAPTDDTVSAALITVPFGTIASLRFLGADEAPALSHFVKDLSTTHGFDSEQTDLCILWAMTTRELIIYGASQLSEQISWLSEPRRQEWKERLSTSEHNSSGRDPLSALLECSGAVAERDWSDYVPRRILRISDPGDRVVFTSLRAGGEANELPALQETFSEATSALFDEVEKLTVQIIELNCEDPWFGYDADSMLRRAASNVVMRTTNIAPTDDFDTAEELQQWLDRCAYEASSAARFEVAFSEAPNPEQIDENAKASVFLGSDHIHSPHSETEIPVECIDARERLWIPIPFDPNFQPESYFENYFAVDFTPAIETVYEGKRLTQVHGTLSLEEQSGKAFISQKPPSQYLEHEGWLLVRPLGTPSFLPLPGRSSILQLEFDHDGASLSLKVVGSNS
ncbi:hypothetical protein ACTXI4_08965 [Glutamicibacter ardleyensis]